MCSMFSQQRNLGTHMIHEFSEWFPVSRDNSDHMKADRKNSVKIVCLWILNSASMNTVIIR